ncbi:MAG: class I SAM-dependent methyltransferase [Pseudomonadota bacterium]
MNVLASALKAAQNWRTPATQLIDARKLAAEMPDAVLLAAADAYFAGLTVQSEQCLKPFSNVRDAIHITRNLSLLLDAADLFPGCDVVDFGCATGWLTLGLAQMGCTATGVDISPAALALAAQLQERTQPRPPGAAAFLVYDGHRLPLDNASVDRVLCFDSFHHVKDQEATLAEFARVLRPGGRVVMLEPGPRHSITEKSQEEMTRYKVIENDIAMHTISALSVKAGLSKPQMLVQLQAPVRMDVDEFLDWSSSTGASHPLASGVVSQLHRQLTDTQCFYAVKPGSAGVDSRHAGELGAELTLVSSTATGAGSWEMSFTALNTGTAAWITEGGRIGQVSLGCQRVDRAGAVMQVDFMRFPIEQVEPVMPGTSVTFNVVVPEPQAGEGYRFELVAEHVAWFAAVNGNRPVNWWAAQA